MPFYLSQYEEFKPGACRPGGAQPGFSSIDLRPDGGATVGGEGLNRCLLYLPTPSVDPALFPLADLPDEIIPTGRRNQLASRVGLASLTATRLHDIVGELLLAPPTNGWKPLRPEAGGARYGAYLGPLTWTQPIVAGGSAPVARPLVRDFRSCPRWRRWGRFLLNLHGVGAVLFSDAFTYANTTDLNTVNANWVSTGAPQGIISNQLNSPDNFNNGVRYAGVTWPNDQYAQAVFVALADSDQSSRCRNSTVAYTFYAGGRDPNNGLSNAGIWKVIASLWTSIQDTGTTLSAGNTVYLEVQGTTLKLKVNGTQVGTNATDVVIASGQAGIGTSHTTTVALCDNFEGGDFAAAAGGTPERTKTGVGTKLYRPRLPHLIGLGALAGVLRNPRVTRRALLGLGRRDP